MTGIEHHYAGFSRPNIVVERAFVIALFAKGGNQLGHGRIAQIDNIAFAKAEHVNDVSLECLGIVMGIGYLWYVVLIVLVADNDRYAVAVLFLRSGDLAREGDRYDKGEYRASHNSSPVFGEQLLPPASDNWVFEVN
jgi:hypothetical protein